MRKLILLSVIPFLSFGQKTTTKLVDKNNNKLGTEDYFVDAII